MVHWLELALSLLLLTQFSIVSGSLFPPDSQALVTVNGVVTRTFTSPFLAACSGSVTDGGTSTTRSSPIWLSLICKRETQWIIPTQPLGVHVVSASRAYIAASFAMILYDITNVLQPVELGRYTPVSGTVAGVVVDTTLNRAYIANTESMLIIDVAQPTNMQLLGTYASGGSGSATGVTLHGSVVYLANKATLDYIDVSNPAAPVRVSFMNAGSATAVTTNTAGTLTALSTYSYVHLLDTTDRTAPVTHAVIGPGVILGVALQEKILFAANYYTLDLYDLTILSAPRMLTSIPAAVGRAAGVGVFGIRAFMPNYNTVEVLDLTEWTLSVQPTIDAAFTTLDIQVESKKFDGTNALLNYILRLSIDSTPRRLVNSFTTQSILADGSTTASVDFSTRTVFVNPTPFSLILSTKILSRTSSLALTGAQATPAWMTLEMAPIPVGAYRASAGIGATAGIGSRGSTILLAHYWEVHILDCTNTSAPILKATYSAPVGIVGISTMSINNNLGLLATNPSLLLMDLSNILAPSVLYTYSAAPGASGQGVIRGSLAYYVNSVSLQVLNIGGGGTTLSLISTTNAPFGESWTGVDVLDTKVFLTTGSTVRVYSVATTTPAYITTYTPQVGRPYGITLNGNLAFLAKQDGVEILDIRDTGAITVLGTYSVGSSGGVAYATAFNGDTLFISNGVGGMVVVDISQWHFSAGPAPADSSATGNFEVALAATDYLGGEVTNAPFILRVEGAPTFNGVIAKQYAKIGRAFSYFLPAGLCTDPNLDTITFEATLDSGAALPSWLAFNSVAGSFFGTPIRQTDVGMFTIRIRARDLMGPASFGEIKFDLQVSWIPAVATPIPPTPLLREGRSQVLAIDRETFAQPDQRPLTFEAKLADGSALPAWITFVGTTLTFSMVPGRQHVGSVSLIVTATNDLGDSIDAPLTLDISSNQPPSIAQPMTVQTASVGFEFTFIVPIATFQPLAGDILFYNVSLEDDSPLPNWLSFDNTTQRFFGTPTRSDVDHFGPRRLQVAVHAWNYPFVQGSHATTIFELRVTGQSWAQLLLEIFGPIASAATTMIACWQARYMLLNNLESRRKRYLKPVYSVVAGSTWVYRLLTPLDQVSTLAIGLPQVKLRWKWQTWIKPHYLPLPGGQTTLHWVEYDATENLLRSVGVTPLDSHEESRLYVVQVRDEAGLITEEFQLAVVPSEEAAQAIAADQNEMGPTGPTHDNITQQSVHRIEMNGGIREDHAKNKVVPVELIDLDGTNGADASSDDADHDVAAPTSSLSTLSHLRQRLVALQAHQATLMVEHTRLLASINDAMLALPSQPAKPIETKERVGDDSEDQRTAQSGPAISRKRSSGGSGAPASARDGGARGDSFSVTAGGSNAASPSGALSVISPNAPAQVESAGAAWPVSLEPANATTPVVQFHLPGEELQNST